MSIIFQIFWRLFLELFCAEAALNVRYQALSQEKTILEIITVMGLTNQF